MVIITAGDHRLHVQNAYLLHILRMSWLRYSTVVKAVWSISLTYYKTTIVSQPYRYMSVRSQFTIRKDHMFFAILQDTLSLLLSTDSTEETIIIEILLIVT